MVTSQDPVATGLVDSLQRPAGNVTGLTLLTRELSGKRLELLKEIVPRMLSVGVLGASYDTCCFPHYERAARALKIPIQYFGVTGPTPDFEGAFRAAVKRRVNAVVTPSTVLLLNYPKKIAEIAATNRLSSMFEGKSCINAGGLLSYAADDDASWRRAATYVDKILKGVKPADLPVEQPTKFELVINLRTAKQIGLHHPAECAGEGG